MSILSGLIDAFDPEGKSVQGFMGNFFGGAKDTVTGLAGLAGHLVQNPADIDDVITQFPSALVSDIKDRYFDGDIAQEAYDRPFDFALDALGGYAVARGAGLGGKALTAVEKAAAARFPTAAYKAAQMGVLTPEAAAAVALGGGQGLAGLASSVMLPVGRKGEMVDVNSQNVMEHLPTVGRIGSREGYTPGPTVHEVPSQVSWRVPDAVKDVAGDSHAIAMTHKPVGYQGFMGNDKGVPSVPTRYGDEDYAGADMMMRSLGGESLGTSFMDPLGSRVPSMHSRMVQHDDMPPEVLDDLVDYIGGSPLKNRHLLLRYLLESEENYRNTQAGMEAMGFGPDDLVPIYHGGNSGEMVTPGPRKILIGSLNPGTKGAATFINPHMSVPEMRMFEVPRKLILGIGSGEEGEVFFLGAKNIAELLKEMRDPASARDFRKFKDLYDQILLGGDISSKAKAAGKLMVRTRGNRVEGRWGGLAQSSGIVPELQTYADVPDLAYLTGSGVPTPVTDASPMAWDADSLATTYEPVMDFPDEANVPQGMEQDWTSQAEADAYAAANGIELPPPPVVYSGKANIAGEGEKHFFTTPDGERMLFKVARTKLNGAPFPAKAFAEELGSKLQAIIHGESGVPIKATTLPVNGVEEFGVLMPFIEGAKNLNEIAGGAWDLTPVMAQLSAQIPDLVPHMQREHVLDWLISQHDTQPAQVIVGPDGKIAAIDKEQAYRYFKSPGPKKLDPQDDALDWNFHPNHMYGEKEPVYNSIVKAYINGDISLTSAPYFEAIERIEAMDEMQFAELIDDYATSRFGDDPAKKLEFVSQALNRKSNLREHFTEYIAGIKKEKAQTTGIYADSPQFEDILDPASGATIRVESPHENIQLDPDNIGPKDLTQSDPNQKFLDESLDKLSQEMPDQPYHAMKWLVDQGISKKHGMVLLRKKFGTMKMAQMETIYDNVRKGIL